MQDTDLLRAWQAGDKRAGRALIVRHYEPVYSFFRSKLVHPAAEELALATFERFCVEVVEQNLDHGLRPHLFAVARYKLIDYVRRSKRMSEGVEPLMHSTLDVGCDHSMVSKVAGRQQLAGFYAALRRIPLDARILIELKHYEQFTAAELGVMFGRSTDVMRARVQQALLRLSEELQCAAAESDGVWDRGDELGAYLDALRQRAAQVH